MYKNELKKIATEVSVCGITALEIDNGLVKIEKGIVDNLSLIMQLGAM
tara:strand:+ start:366 stop:509 length:144 start_codon:yes stop_codon:yes gene_type:complete